jgi:hypothetical protein
VPEPDRRIEQITFMHDGTVVTQLRQFAALSWERPPDELIDARSPLDFDSPRVLRRGSQRA